MSPSFADLGVPSELLAVLTKLGIEEPFPIQTATLPDAFAGRDVSGRAPTGSGKTLAFGLPVVASLAQAASSGRRRPGPGRPQALILVPTRELASQVERTLAPLAQAVGARTMSIYGGVGYGPQRTALRRGIDIVVGCPGRLEDLVAQGALDLGWVTSVVVDEADRMADMGFLPAVRRLLDGTHADRQTLLFSATLDGEVDVLVRRYQHQPRRHEVVEDESDRGTTYHVFWNAESDKRSELTAEVIAAHAPSVVFCRTRHGADRLVKRLAGLGVNAAPIHGGRSQPQRDKALSAFTTGRVQALVATDVAARGIHVDDVASVIHFDPPADAKDYTHRSGRTGRAGADGLVLTLAGRAQAKAVRTMARQAGVDANLVDPDIAALPEIARPERPARPAGPAYVAERTLPPGGRGARSSGGYQSRSGGGPGRSHRGAPAGGRRHSA